MTQTPSTVHQHVYVERDRSYTSFATRSTKIDCLQQRLLFVIVLSYTLLDFLIFCLFVTHNRFFNHLLFLPVIGSLIGCRLLLHQQSLRLRNPDWTVRIFAIWHLSSMLAWLFSGGYDWNTVTLIQIILLGGVGLLYERPNIGRWWVTLCGIAVVLVMIHRLKTSPLSEDLVLHTVETVLASAIALLMLGAALLVAQQLRQLKQVNIQQQFALEQAYREVEMFVHVRTSELENSGTQLALAKAEAERLNRLKSDILATLSHELRTPLNAIINFTDLINKPRQGLLTDKQRFLQERILVNAEHLLNMINDLLDVARLEAGQTILVLETLDLGTLLQDCLDTTTALLKDKPVTLALELPVDGLPIVQADQLRLKQVVLNLLSNAAKFTDTGQIKVWVGVPANMIEIGVSDTGSGIAPHDQARVFEPFQQGSHALTQQHGGTGLGLSISRRLIELHGGEITLESVPGQGSTFTIRLPLIAQHMPVAAAQPSTNFAAIVTAPMINTPNEAKITPNESYVTDNQWQLVAPLLPTTNNSTTYRNALNIVLYVLRTGSRWEDVPSAYGNIQLAHTLYHQWHRQGVWTHIWRTYLVSV